MATNTYVVRRPVGEDPTFSPTTSGPLIKVYENTAAVQAAIESGELVENEIVSTTEEAPFNMGTSNTIEADNLNPPTTDAVYKYIQDQIELDDSIEVLSNPYTCEYDGFVTVWQNANGSTPISMTINGDYVVYFEGAYSTARNSAGFPVKKGDVIQGTGNSLQLKGRFYKKRDYSGR